MAIGVSSGVGGPDEITASPLLLQQNAKGERQTLRGYDSVNEAAPRGKNYKVRSDLGQNVVHHLSNVDTDKMQKQFLSNRDTE